MLNRSSFAIGALVQAAAALFSGGAYAQSSANSLPNPYRLVRSGPSSQAGEHGAR